MQPDSFTVQRSTDIQAPAEKIFPFVHDFSRWQAWSPRDTKDPAMKRTISTPSAGKGASYAWEGNDEDGEGQMTIVESARPDRIAIKLDFTAPFETHNDVTFALLDKNAATGVTWTMQGPMPFTSKLIGVFVSMDTMVGKDFETGLANLKATAEK